MTPKHALNRCVSILIAIVVVVNCLLTMRTLRRANHIDLGLLSYRYIDDAVFYHDDELGLLFRWAAKIVPDHAGILLLNRWQDGDQKYFRASYDLAPRHVWWAKPDPRTFVFDWHIPISLKDDMLAQICRQYGVQYILVSGIVPEEIPQARAAPILWFDQSQAQYLIRVMDDGVAAP